MFGMLETQIQTRKNPYKMNIVPGGIDIDGNRNTTTQTGGKFRKDVNYYNPPQNNSELYHRAISIGLVVITLILLTILIILVVVIVKINGIEADILQLHNLLNSK